MNPLSRLTIKKHIIKSLLGGLVDKRLVDVRDNTATSYCSFDKSVKFFITANSKLQMPGCDTLYLQILACITSQLQNFCSQVLQDSSRVYSSGCPNSPVCCNPWLQKTVDSTDRKLQNVRSKMRYKLDIKKLGNVTFWEQFKNQSITRMKFLRNCITEQINEPKFQCTSVQP